MSERLPSPDPKLRPRRRSRAGLWLGRVAMAILLVTLLPIAAWSVSAVLSVPPVAGTYRVAGPSAEIRIERDVHGIPVIHAASAADGHFGLGFVHAQDRLWQMEAMRRLGAGRMAEIVGPFAVEFDLLGRTLGLHRLAQASLAHLDASTLAALDAYAAGVNAWINSPDFRRPPEFVLLGFSPEPWTPADSLVWGRLMAMFLSGNWQQELLRARLIGKLGPDRAAALFPEAVFDPVTTRPRRLAALDAATELADVADDLRRVLSLDGASNALVLSPARTTFNAAALSHDPHLGLQIPIQWYLAEIRTPDLTLSGATTPGVPFHVFGHNGHISWGLTTTYADTQDLVYEKLDGPDRYLTPDGPVAFETREEVIRVRFGEDRRVTVRASRHGPIISDARRSLEPLPDGQVLALRGAPLEPDDRTAQALLRLNRATGWEQAREALRDYHAPVQNIFIATTAGDIAFIAPGRIPVRTIGDGSLPQDGWSLPRLWSGWIPFEELPSLVNPSEGYILNANNRVVPPNYPHLITSAWPAGGARASRMEELVKAMSPFDTDELAALMQDTLSVGARTLSPGLLALIGDAPPAGDDIAAALAILRGWDGRMDPDLAAPLIHTAWVQALAGRMLAAPLGEDFRRVETTDEVMLGLLGDAASWCGTADGKGDCAPVAREALTEAIAALRDAHGDDPRAWRWGDAHRARFGHLPFRLIPGLAQASGRTLETPGGNDTVNRGAHGSEGLARFPHVHGAGFRGVYAMTAQPEAGYIIATGQSGHFLSGRYDDLLERWLRGGLIRPGEPAALTLLTPESPKP